MTCDKCKTTGRKWDNYCPNCGNNLRSETARPDGSAFECSAIVLLLSRWRDIAERNVIEANKREISATVKIGQLAYARGIHDLANRIEDELSRAGEKENDQDQP